MERINVWPAPGVVVPDPFEGSDFPPEGREVDRTAYIERRLLDGSLVTVAPGPRAVRAAKPA